MADGAENFPCCEHCQYPGCPPWTEHQVRCWRCLTGRLTGLCKTHAEEYALSIAVFQLREYVTQIDKESRR